MNVAIPWVLVDSLCCNAKRHVRCTERNHDTHVCRKRFGMSCEFLVNECPDISGDALSFMLGLWET